MTTRSQPASLFGGLPFRLSAVPSRSFIRSRCSRCLPNSASIQSNQTRCLGFSVQETDSPRNVYQTLQDLQHSEILLHFQVGVGGPLLRMLPHPSCFQCHCFHRIG